MKLLIVTAYNEPFNAIAEISVPRMQKYADRYNCAIRVIADADCILPDGWVKIPAIRQALTESFDYIFWLDADTLFIRDDIDIRSAIVPSVDLQLTWEGAEGVDRQASSASVSNFNTGVMLVRNCSWSRDFFRRTWECGEIAARSRWQPQTAILHLLGYDDRIGAGPRSSESLDRARVGYLDPIWNSIPGMAAAADPIIHHYAGMTAATRFTLMQADQASTFPFGATIKGAARAVRSRELDQIAKLIREGGAAIRSKQARIAELSADLLRRDGRIAALSTSLQDYDTQIANRDAQIDELSAMLAATYASTSWRLTAPLRQARLLMSSIKGGLRARHERLSSGLRAFARGTSTSLPADPLEIQLSKFAPRSQVIAQQRAASTVSKASDQSPQVRRVYYELKAAIEKDEAEKCA